MPLRAARDSHSGVTVLKVALLLPFCLALAAVGVDAGLFYMQLAELEVAASSAAAGAALDLPDEVASTATRLVAANMPSAVHGTVLSGDDIQAGFWNSKTRTFTSGAIPVNAVRVTVRKSTASGNAVNWLFGSIFGIAPVNLAASATAVRLPELPGAIASRSTIDLSGIVSIDSYDPRLGPYGVDTAGSDGDIVADGSISLTGSAFVDGDAKSSSVSLSGSATVTGDVSAPRRPVELASVDMTDAATNNDNASLPLIEQGNNLVSPMDANRNFSLQSGVDYSLPPGTYYFNDFSLSGQASLTVSGPTVIYLTGNLDTSGGDVINSTQVPNNLQIFMSGGTAKLNAGVDWYGLLYAPDTTVTVSGTADIYGAVIGESVTTSGTADLHFDVSLSVTDVIQMPKRSTIVQ